MQKTIDAYNRVARFRGWLPVNITLSDTRRTINDAADRAYQLFPDVAANLRAIADSVRT